jgi:hypothetical protein
MGAGTDGRHPGPDPIASNVAGAGSGLAPRSGTAGESFTHQPTCRPLGGAWPCAWHDGQRGAG